MAKKLQGKSAQEDSGSWFGNRLAAARKAAGLSQEELAATMDLASSSTISKWENSQTYPTIKHLPKLAAALNVPPIYLLNWIADLSAEHKHGIFYTVNKPHSNSHFSGKNLDAGVDFFEMVVRDGRDTATIRKEDERFKSMIDANIRLLVRSALLTRSVQMVDVERDELREKNLREKYNLRGCFVAKLDGLPADLNIDSTIRCDAVSLLAACNVIDELEGVRYIGLVGGRMISRFVDLIPPMLDKLAGKTWVSMLATAGTVAPYAPTANSVVSRMTYNQPGTDGYRMPFINTIRREERHFQDAQGVERDELVKADDVLRMTANLQAVIMSVGTPGNYGAAVKPDAAPLQGLLGHLSKEDQDRCVGDILLRLVDSQGRRVGSEKHQQENDAIVYSIKLDTLGAICSRGQVWILAAEKDKVDVVRGALTAGLANCVCLDSNLADLLLKKNRVVEHSSH